MAFSRVIGALKRRWYIVVVGLIVTGGIAWAVPQISPPEYTARGLVLLLPPVSQDTGTNPFLALGGLEIPARVVVAAYSSNALKEQIATQDPKADVAVSMEESTRGPVIAVDVKAASADGAISMLTYTAQSIPDTLARLQNEVQVPDASRVKSMPLTMDVEAEENKSGTIRLLIVGIGGGLALTVLAVYAFDAALPKRRRLKAPVIGNPAGPVSVPPPSIEEQRYAADEQVTFDDARRFVSSPVPAAPARRADLTHRNPS